MPLNPDTLNFVLDPGGSPSPTPSLRSTTQQQPTPTPTPTPPTQDGNQFMRGLRSRVAELSPMVDATQGIVQGALGFEEAAQANLREAAAGFQRADELAPRTKTISQWEDVGDFTDALLGQLGRFAVDIPFLVASTGAGALAGKGVTAALRGAASAAARRQAVKYGAAAGAGAGAFTQQSTEVGRTLTEPGVMASVEENLRLKRAERSTRDPDLRGVARVIDGDTIEVMDPRYDRPIKIRPYGVNAADKGQEGYQAATDYLRQTLEGREVRVLTGEDDEWGRSLGHIYADDSGFSVNEQMLKAGQAAAATTHVRHMPGYFQQYEQEGRAQPGALPTYLGRYADAPVTRTYTPPEMADLGGQSLTDITRTSAMGMAAAAGLDLLPMFTAVERFLPGSSTRIANTFLQRAARQGAKQTVMEAGTEGLQTVIERAVAAEIDANREVLSEEGVDEIVTAMVLGGVMGGMGGVATAIPGPEFGVGEVVQTPQTPQTPPTTQTPQARPAVPLPPEQEVARLQKREQQRQVALNNPDVLNSYAQRLNISPEEMRQKLMEASKREMAQMPTAGGAVVAPQAPATRPMPSFQQTTRAPEGYSTEPLQNVLSDDGKTLRPESVREWVTGRGNLTLEQNGEVLTIPSGMRGDGTVLYTPEGQTTAKRIPAADVMAVIQRNPEAPAIDQLFNAARRNEPLMRKDKVEPSYILRFDNRVESGQKLVAQKGGVNVVEQLNEFERVHPLADRYDMTTVVTQPDRGRGSEDPETQYESAREAAVSFMKERGKVVTAVVDNKLYFATPEKRQQFYENFSLLDPMAEDMNMLKRAGTMLKRPGGAESTLRVPAGFPRFRNDPVPGSDIQVIDGTVAKMNDVGGNGVLQVTMEIKGEDGKTMLNKGIARRPLTISRTDPQTGASQEFSEPEGVNEQLQLKQAAPTDQFDATLHVMHTVADDRTSARISYQGVLGGFARPTEFITRDTLRKGEMRPEDFLIPGNEARFAAGIPLNALTDMRSAFNMLTMFEVPGVRDLALGVTESEGGLRPSILNPDNTIQRHGEVALMPETARDLVRKARQSDPNFKLEPGKTRLVLHREPSLVDGSGSNVFIYVGEARMGGERAAKRGIVVNSSDPVGKMMALDFDGDHMLAWALPDGSEDLASPKDISHTTNPQKAFTSVPKEYVKGTTVQDIEQSLALIYDGLSDQIGRVIMPARALAEMGRLTPELADLATKTAQGVISSQKKSVLRTELKGAMQRLSKEVATLRKKRGGMVMGDTLSKLKNAAPRDHQRIMTEEIAKWDAALQRGNSEVPFTNVERAMVDRMKVVHHTMMEHGFYPTDEKTSLLKPPLLKEALKNAKGERRGQQMVRDAVQQYHDINRLLAIIPSTEANKGRRQQLYMQANVLRSTLEISYKLGDIDPVTMMEAPLSLTGRIVTPEDIKTVYPNGATEASLRVYDMGTTVLPEGVYAAVQPTATGYVVRDKNRNQYHVETTATDNMRGWAREFFDRAHTFSVSHTLPYPVAARTKAGSRRGVTRSSQQMLFTIRKPREAAEGKWKTHYENLRPAILREILGNNSIAGQIGQQVMGRTATGINISSYESGLGKMLSNFAPTPVTFDGVRYASAEQAYQQNKSKLTSLSDESVLGLMVRVITAKLQQHSMLTQQITQSGGEAFLNASSHNLVRDGRTVKSDRWTGQNGLFMRALREAYRAVGPTSGRASPLTDVERRNLNHPHRKAFLAKAQPYVQDVARRVGIKEPVRVLLAGKDDDAIMRAFVPSQAAEILNNDIGGAHRFVDGTHYIALSQATQGGTAHGMYGILAHEIGHMVEEVHYRQVRGEPSIRQEYEDWRDRWRAEYDAATTLAQKNDVLTRAYSSVARSRTANIDSAYLNPEYVLSFDEWFAENVHAWFRTGRKPQTHLQKFFARMAKAIKEYFVKLAADPNFPKPARSVEQFMDAIWDDAAQISLDDLSVEMIEDLINTATAEQLLPAEVRAKVNKLLKQEQPMPITDMPEAIPISKAFLTAKVMQDENSRAHALALLAAHMEGGVEQQQAALAVMFNHVLGPEDRRLLNEGLLTPFNRKRLAKRLADPRIETDYTYAATRLYTMWLRGEFRVGPKTHTIFGKLLKLVRDILGIVTKGERIEQLFRFVRDGRNEYATAMEKMRNYRLRVTDVDQHRRNQVQRATHATRKIVRYLGQMTRDYVRQGYEAVDQTNPALRKLSEAFHNNYYSMNNRGTLHEAVLGKTSEYNLRFIEEVHQKLNDDNERTRLLQHWAEGTVPTDPEMRAALGKLRTLMDDLRTYAVAQGVRLGKRQNYMPWVFEPEAMMDDKEGFIDLLIRHAPDDFWRQEIYFDPRTQKRQLRFKMPKDTPVTDAMRRDGAEKVYHAIVMSRDGDASADFNDSYTAHTPYMGAQETRVLGFIPQQEMLPYLSQDLANVVLTYISQTVKRSEFTNRFGIHGEKIDALFDQARQHGADREEIARAERFISGNMGTLGINRQGIWGNRELGDALITYQNYRLLSLSSLTGLTDSAGVYFRSGDIREVMSNLGSAIREFARNDGDLHQLARAVGTASNDVVDDALAWGYGLRGMDGVFKSLNDALFRWNGTRAMTEVVRTWSLGVAQRMLAKKATSTNPKDVREMRNLGVQDGDVRVDAQGRIILLTDTEERALLKRVATARENGGTDAAAQAQLDRNDRVRTALMRYVDQSHIRPTASTRPIAASDQHLVLRLVYHLQSFMWGFWENFTKRGYLQMKEVVAEMIDTGHVSPAEAAQAALTVVRLLPFALIYMFAEMLRDLIQHGMEEDPFKRGWEGEDWLAYSIAASGVFGPLEFSSRMVDEQEQGHWPIEALYGPTFQQVMDIWRGDSSIEKSLPFQNVYRWWFD